METKNSLDVIKEMTQKIKLATESLLTITEKRYQYSKEECETIFTNIFNAVDEYVAKDKGEDAYEKLLNALSDRFKIGTTGGDISRQVDNLATAEELYEKQTEFQEMLDSAKDVVEFINDKAEKLEGIAVKKATSEPVEGSEPVKEDTSEHFEKEVHEEQEITESKKKWIPTRIRKCALHKKLGIPEDERIPLELINKEIKRLQALAEGDKKLSKEDATFLKQLILARTFKKMNK